jgi:hypothetical protein
MYDAEEAECSKTGKDCRADGVCSRFKKKLLYL